MLGFELFYILDETLIKRLNDSSFNSWRKLQKPGRFCLETVDPRCPSVYLIRFTIHQQEQSLRLKKKKKKRKKEEDWNSVKSDELRWYSCMLCAAVTHEHTVSCCVRLLVTDCGATSYHVQSDCDGIYYYVRLIATDIVSTITSDCS